MEESIVSDIDKNVSKILDGVAGERLGSWYGRRSGGWEAGGNCSVFGEIHVAEEIVGNVVDRDMEYKYCALDIAEQ